MRLSHFQSVVLVLFLLQVSGVKAATPPSNAIPFHTALLNQGATVENFCYFGSSGPEAACPAGAYAGRKAGFIEGGSAHWGGVPALFGDSYAFIQGDGVLEFEFWIDDGASEILTFYDYSRPNNPDPGFLSYRMETFFDREAGRILEWSGIRTTVAPTPWAQGWQYGAPAWLDNSTGAATTGLVRFTGLSDSDQTAFITSIATASGSPRAFILVPTAVPEPSTWAMMILGFGAVGGAMRAARKSFLRHAAV